MLRLRAGFTGFGGAALRARFLSVFLASDTFFFAILAPSSELAGPTVRRVRPGTDLHGAGPWSPAPVFGPCSPS